MKYNLNVSLTYLSTQVCQKPNTKDFQFRDTKCTQCKHCLNYSETEKTMEEPGGKNELPMNKGQNYLKDPGQSKLRVTVKMLIACHNRATVPRKLLTEDQI